MTKEPSISTERNSTGTKGLEQKEIALEDSPSSAASEVDRDHE